MRTETLLSCTNQACFYSPEKRNQLLIATICAVAMGSLAYIGVIPPLASISTAVHVIGISFTSYATAYAAISIWKALFTLSPTFLASIQAIHDEANQTVDTTCALIMIAYDALSACEILEKIISKKDLTIQTLKEYQELRKKYIETCMSDMSNEQLKTSLNESLQQNLSILEKNISSTDPTSLTAWVKFIQNTQVTLQNLNIQTSDSDVKQRLAALTKLIAMNACIVQKLQTLSSGQNSQENTQQVLTTMIKENQQNAAALTEAFGLTKS